MRLTKTIRSAFVRAAMNDVPQIDYDEQIRKMLVDSVVAQMPPDLLKAYQKHPKMFNNEGHYVTGIGYVYYPCNGINPTPEVNRAVNELIAKKKTQSETRRALMDKLESTAESVTTRKALVNLLPEFEKYLPKEDEPASRQVPAIANLVADFTKAGWPKQDEQKGKK